jgi:hypothetical protein
MIYFTEKHLAGGMGDDPFWAWKFFWLLVSSVRHAFELWCRVTLIFLGVSIGCRPRLICPWITAWHWHQSWNGMFGNSDMSCRWNIPVHLTTWYQIDCRGQAAERVEADWETAREHHCVHRFYLSVQPKQKKHGTAQCSHTRNAFMLQTGRGEYIWICASKWFSSFFCTINALFLQDFLASCADAYRWFAPTITTMYLLQPEAIITTWTGFFLPVLRDIALQFYFNMVDYGYGSQRCPP